MKKILVSTDFSQQAKNALEFACGIAKKTGASVHLINVVEHPAYNTFNASGEGSLDGGFDELYVIQLIKRNRDLLHQIVKDEVYKEFNIVPHLRVGSEFHNIAEVISEESADLMIIGISNLSGMEEILIGSNAEKIVRLAHCPVITLRKPIEANAINDIVFASNFTGDEKPLVDRLKQLQEVFGAKLHLVKVNTPSNFETTRAIRQRIIHFVKLYDISNYTINIYSDVLQEDGIIYFSEDIKADMIAMATHGRTGLMHLIFGSIAEDVLNHAKRPVWTFSLKNK